MSEWKRNRRKTDGYPAGVFAGKQIEVKKRSGKVQIGVVGSYGFTTDNFNTSDNSEFDVMQYRIIESEPAKPDYSKGFPDGVTSDDIGAKIGDKFLVVNTQHAEKCEIVTIVGDDGSIRPLFDCEEGRFYLYWGDLTPIPQKTAIELQAEEVGIPEPVRHVAGEGCDTGMHLGVKRPDGDGWVKYNAGDKIDLCGVESIDWADRIGYAKTCPAPHELRWADGETDQIAWYRLNYAENVDSADTSPERVEKQDEIVHMPATSGGGKLSGNHYYRVEVKRPISDELPPYMAECADIIEALDMTFNEGEAFKALWRMAAARQGNGKAGSNQQYDADKVAHYGARVAAHASLKAESLANNKEGK